MVIPTATQINSFAQDGFIALDKIIDTQTADKLRSSFDRIFSGNFETGKRPDEVNWQSGQSDPLLTRQICNAWRADRTIASVVLDAGLGELVACLMGWSGTRIMQDNAIWKPVGAKSLGFHQDNAYLAWFSPAEICSVWIALDDVDADNGTLELARGSHRWGHSEPEAGFHAPLDYRAALLLRARELGLDPDIVALSANKGGGSVHHGWCWHGSGENGGKQDRRALVLHAMCDEVTFVPQNFHLGTGPIYSRYAFPGSTTMDESSFPVLWSKNGYRSAEIAELTGSDD